LLFSLVARKQHDESFSSVRVSYWKIHEAVKGALESLGRNPRFFRCDEKLERGADCFRFPIATDLAIGAEKIAGGAQKRSDGVLLHQESIQLKEENLDAQALVLALQEGFEKIFGITLIPAPLDPALLEAAEKLAQEKYGCEVASR
jgi:lipoate-protein ligase A